MFNKNEYKVLFIGDTTWGENYQTKLDLEEKRNILRQKGYDYPFEGVKDMLLSSDHVIANLETPITNALRTSLEGKKPCIHWTDIDLAPKYLKKYNIETVSLGNNHAYDYEHEGLKQTVEILEKNQINLFGAGLNEEQAEEPFVKDIKIRGKNTNMVVVGGYKYRKDYDELFDFYAKGNKSGVNLLTPEKTSKQIQKIKENNPDSYIVAFPHFGFDLKKTVTHQVEMAHAFIDAGADIVIGHGPHMINKIEKYKDKWIIYSLGNFVFLARFKDKSLPYGAAAELIFKNQRNAVRTKALRLYPLFTKNTKNDYQTRHINKEEIEEFMGYLTENTDEAVKNSLKLKKNKVGFFVEIDL